MPSNRDTDRGRGGEGREGSRDRRKDDSERLLNIIHKDIHAIMATQAEHAEKLRAHGVKLDKIHSETSGLKQLIADLRAAVEAAGQVSSEVEEALAAAESKATAVDELVDDATPPAPPNP